jgi:hypothetical protein
MATTTQPARHNETQLGASTVTRPSLTRLRGYWVATSCRHTEGGLFGKKSILDLGPREILLYVKRGTDLFQATTSIQLGIDAAFWACRRAGATALLTGVATRSRGGGGGAPPARAGRGARRLGRTRTRQGVSIPLLDAAGTTVDAVRAVLGGGVTGAIVGCGVVPALPTPSTRGRRRRSVGPRQRRLARHERHRAVDARRTTWKTGPFFSGRLKQFPHDAQHWARASAPSNWRGRWARPRLLVGVGSMTRSGRRRWGACRWVRGQERA